MVSYTLLIPKHVLFWHYHLEIYSLFIGISFRFFFRLYFSNPCIGQHELSPYGGIFKGSIFSYPQLCPQDNAVYHTLAWSIADKKKPQSIATVGVCGLWRPAVFYELVDVTGLEPATPTMSIPNSVKCKSLINKINLEILHHLKDKNKHYKINNNQ